MEVRGAALSLFTEEGDIDLTVLGELENEFTEALVGELSYVKFSLWVMLGRLSEEEASDGPAAKELACAPAPMAKELPGDCSEKWLAAVAKLFAELKELVREPILKLLT